MGGIIVGILAALIVVSCAIAMASISGSYGEIPDGKTIWDVSEPFRAATWTMVSAASTGILTLSGLGLHSAYKKHQRKKFIEESREPGTVRDRAGEVTTSGSTIP